MHTTLYYYDLGATLTCVYNFLKARTTPTQLQIKPVTVNCAYLIRKHVQLLAELQTNLLHLRVHTHYTIRKHIQSLAPTSNKIVKT